MSNEKEDNWIQQQIELLADNFCLQNHLPTAKAFLLSSRIKSFVKGIADAKDKEAEGLRRVVEAARALMKEWEEDIGDLNFPRKETDDLEKALAALTAQKEREARWTKWLSE